MCLRTIRKVIRAKVWLGACFLNADGFLPISIRHADRVLSAGEDSLHNQAAHSVCP